MKKTIRTGCFETNSSSSHSISLSRKNSNIKINYNGDVLELEGGEFGWGYECYSDWMTKANYAAVAIENRNLKQHKEWLIEVLKEKLNCSEVIFKFGEWAGIDHQSEDVFEYSVESKQDLYDFIFCNSQLIIDNDNH